MFNSLSRAISVPTLGLHVTSSREAAKWCRTSNVFAGPATKIPTELIKTYYELGIVYETRFRLQVDVMIFLHRAPTTTFTLGGMLQYMGKEGFMDDQYRDTIRIWCRDVLDRMIGLGFLVASASPQHMATATPTVLYAVLMANLPTMTKWLGEWIEAFASLGQIEAFLVSEWNRYYDHRWKSSLCPVPPPPHPFQVDQVMDKWKEDQKIDDTFLDLGTAPVFDDVPPMSDAQHELTEKEWQDLNNMTDEQLIELSKPLVPTLPLETSAPVHI